MKAGKQSAMAVAGSEDVSMLAAPAAAPVERGEFLWIAPADLVPSNNPRRTPYPAERFAELVQSVRSRSILQPLNVRPFYAHGERAGYQVVTGDNRRRAAMEANLEAVPCVSRDLSDLDVLEIQLIENIQRQDMHPLDEGAAFAQLIASKQHTAESIASKVGKSIRWVYQRIEFTKLITGASKLFLEGVITTSHAELFTRHTAADQARILKEGLYEPLLGGERLKSVDDLDRWIAHNIRLNLDARTTAALLPEVGDAVKAAKADGAKLLQVAVGWLLNVPTGVLDYQSWKRATGREKCKLSEPAAIVLGEGQGEVLDICRNRECAKHWPTPATAAPRKALSAKEEAQEERDRQKHERWKAKQERDAEQARRSAVMVKAARGKLLAHMVGLKVVSPALAHIGITTAFCYHPTLRELQKAMGQDPAKDLPRALAVASVMRLGDMQGREFIAAAKAAKFDLKPFEPTAAKKPAAKKAGKGKRR